MKETHYQAIARLTQEALDLEALRGSPQEPIALDARLGRLRRKLHWHERRTQERHHNVASGSLFEARGRERAPAPPDPAPILCI